MKAGGRAGDSSAGYSGYDAHTSGLLGYRAGTVSSSVERRRGGVE